jgi:hypothetical protein
MSTLIAKYYPCGVCVNPECDRDVIITKALDESDIATLKSLQLDEEEQYEILAEAYEKDALEVARWLIQEFKIDLDGFSDYRVEEIADILNTRQEPGVQLSSMQKLNNFYVITKEDMSEALGCISVRSIKRLNSSVVDWILRSYYPTFTKEDLIQLPRIPVAPMYRDA